jgi:hypothetical protein
VITGAGKPVARLMVLEAVDRRKSARGRSEILGRSSARVNGSGGSRRRGGEVQRRVLFTAAKQQTPCLKGYRCAAVRSAKSKRAQPFLAEPFRVLVEPTGIEPVTSTMPL